MEREGEGKREREGEREKHSGNYGILLLFRLTRQKVAEKGKQKRVTGKG